MTQSINGDLDVILKRLLEDPLQLENVKRVLQGRMNETGTLFSGQPRSSHRDDDDDLFDNVPV